MRNYRVDIYRFISEQYYIFRQYFFHLPKKRILPREKILTKPTSTVKNKIKHQAGS